MPAARDRASREMRVAGVMASHLADTPLRFQCALAVDDEDGAVEGELARRAVSVACWRRRVAGDRPAQPWPPDGPFDAATLRLPKGRESFCMSLHAVISRLEAGGRLWVYDSNDEGARSAGALLETLLIEVRTVEARGHCRIWQGTRGAAAMALRSKLSDWQDRFSAALPDGPLEIVSYPGLFAHRRVDEGTRFLIAGLPELSSGARVLDFGCGAGVISLALRRRFPTAKLDLVDADALAVDAARRNLPGVRVHLGDGWSALPRGARFDLIVSNPPLHRGRSQDFALLGDLIAGADRRLARSGELLLVAQRRLALRPWLAAHFSTVELRDENRSFRLWSARRPSG